MVPHTTIRVLYNVEVPYGDKVVSAVPWRDHVIIITEQGIVLLATLED